MLFKILLLSIIQGIAELLPVSSSAHVIVAEKLLGLDPSSPEMTFQLVMLHCGTMLAVIFYFWRSWCGAYFASTRHFINAVILIGVATISTGIIGLGLQELIRHVFAFDAAHFQIEDLFGNLTLIAIALAAAGVFILISSRFPERHEILNMTRATAIGAVQGLCLPFRGFSRSGATISMGIMAGASRQISEEFSFALAVVLTPAVLGRELYRLYQARGDLPMHQFGEFLGMFEPGVLGLAFSFGAGLFALRWLSGWLNSNRWHYFGFYCLAAAPVVYLIGRATA